MLLFLAKLESIPVQVNALHKKQPFKKSRQKASFLPFIDHRGLVSSTGRICCLAAVEFNVRRTIILKVRHLLLMMRLTFIHQKNDHQSVDYLRAVIQLEFIVLGIRTALRSIEHHYQQLR